MCGGLIGILNLTLTYNKLFSYIFCILLSYNLICDEKKINDKNLVFTLKQDLSLFFSSSQIKLYQIHIYYFYIKLLKILLRYYLIKKILNC